RIWAARFACCQVVVREEPNSSGGVLILRPRLSGDGEQESRQPERQPGQQSPEVVSGGGEDGVDRVAGWAGEVGATHPMFALGVADDRFDGGALAHLAFHGL